MRTDGLSVSIGCFPLVRYQNMEGWTCLQYTWRLGLRKAELFSPIHGLRCSYNAHSWAQTVDHKYFWSCKRLISANTGFSQATFLLGHTIHVEKDRVWPNFLISEPGFWQISKLQNPRTLLDAETSGVYAKSTIRTSSATACRKPTGRS